MYKGAWQTAVRGVCKELDVPEQPSTHIPISDKGLTSKMCKELIQFNGKNPIKNGQRT